MNKCDAAENKKNTFRVFSTLWYNIVNFYVKLYYLKYYKELIYI